MAIRIYALAKELKIDSKILVDVCNKAGITGKGSALASLSDDEVAKIKDHMGRGKAPAGGAAAPRSTAVSPAAPREFRREDYIAPAGGTAMGKIPVLPTPPKRVDEPEPAAPEGESPGDAVPTPPAPQEPPAPMPPEPPAPSAAPVSPLATSTPASPSPPATTPPVAPSTPPSAPPLSSSVPPLAASIRSSRSAKSPVARPEVSEKAPEKVPEKPQPQQDTPPKPPLGMPTKPPLGMPTKPPLGMPTKPPLGMPAKPPLGMPAKPPEMPLRPAPALSSRPPELSQKQAKPTGGKPDKPPKPPEKTGPTFHLAPMPAASTPPPSKKSKEPTPQKPDIKLPLDAIRASKAGTKPLEEHLRKHEKKKKAADKAAVRSRASDATTPATGTPLPGREGRRRGRAGAAGKEGGAAALGGREHRQLKRKREASARRRRGEDDGGGPRRRLRIRRTGANTAAPRKGAVVVELPCIVRSFSEAVSKPAAEVLRALMDLGATGAININATLDRELAELLATELDVEVEFRQEEALEDKLEAVWEEEEDPTSLEPRPPIVTFLGHVDHGKTSLLDRIIGIDVVSGEKGGITQHIRAYRVQKEGRAVAFVDTPGHEAFTEMRARGANVTDIAVLVVAADDGVMPQTEEAISHAKAAEVPIVVAMNKMDLPGVDPQRIYEQLAANELLPTEWGGDTEVIKTSATTGEGIDDLLETLLTVAELHEYATNRDRAGIGTCLEAESHKGRGVVAKLLVQRGTMKVGDVIVCGPAHGKVKAMYDTLESRKRHKQAGPSTPVNVTGLDVAPGAGDRFHVLDDISEARTLAERRADAMRQRELSGTREHVTLENLFEKLEEQEVQTLNIILRADVRGSIEAIRKELTKLEHPEVQVKILQASVGGVTEADVHLADASDAVIIGFNVVPDERARLLADQRGVQVRRYEIIYQVSEDLRAALEGMLKPEKSEVVAGRALVKQVFQISRLGAIAGCQVLPGGVIQRDCRCRVIRESRIIGDYAVDSLKRVKEDVREVRAGFECGIKLKGYNDLKEGDVLEAYKIEETPRSL